MQKRPLETINREQVEPSLGFQIDSDELRKVREAAGEAGLTGYEFWKLLPVGGASGPANFRKTAPSRSQVKTMLANLRVLRASAAGGGKRGKLPGNLETKHEMHCASLDEAISRAETYSARMDDDYNDRSGLATRGSVQASSRTKIRNRIRAFRTEALDIDPRSATAVQVEDLTKALRDAVGDPRSLEVRSLARAVDRLVSLEWHETSAHRLILPIAGLVTSTLLQVPANLLTAEGVRVLYNGGVIRYHAVDPENAATSFSRVREALGTGALGTLDQRRIAELMAMEPDAFQWLVLHYDVRGTHDRDLAYEFLDRSKHMARTHGGYLCSGLRCHACHLIHFGRTEEALIRIEEAEKAWASSSGSALSQVTMGFYIQLIKAEAYFRSTAKLDRTDKSNARRAVKKAYDLLKEHTLLRRGGRSIRSADVVAPLWEAILHHLRAVFLFEGDPKEQLDTLATAKSYLVRSDNGGCFRSRKSLEADIERLERQLSEQLR